MNVDISISTNPYPDHLLVRRWKKSDHDANPNSAPEWYLAVSTWQNGYPSSITLYDPGTNTGVGNQTMTQGILYYHDVVGYFGSNSAVVYGTPMIDTNGGVVNSCAAPTPVPTTAPPQAPTLTGYTDSNCNTVVNHLSWPPGVSGAVSYTLHRTDGGQVSGNALSWDDGAIVNNTSYTYNIYATNSSGQNSPDSNPITLNHPACAAPTATPIPTPTTPPFSYYLSKPSDISVNQGGTVFNTVTANLLQGTSQNVTFTTPPLPPGIYLTFNPGSCFPNPTCQSNLTIITSSSTSAGTYPITVTGTSSSGVTSSTFFNLNVNAVATPTNTPTPTPTSTPIPTPTPTLPPGVTPLPTATPTPTPTIFNQPTATPAPTSPPPTPQPGPVTLTSGVSYCNGSSPYIYLNWSSSSYASFYNLYRDNSPYANNIPNSQTSYPDYSVNPGTTYYYYLIAFGNGSSTSNTYPVTARTDCAGTPQPTPTPTPTPTSAPGPGGFIMGNPITYCDGSSSVIYLSWSQSSNAYSYDLFKNNSYFTTVYTPNFTVSDYGVTAGNTYTYYAIARDTSGNPTQSLNSTNPVIALNCAAPTATPTPTPTPPAALPDLMILSYGIVAPNPAYEGQQITYYATYLNQGNTTATPSWSYLRINPDAGGLTSNFQTENLLPGHAATFYWTNNIFAPSAGQHSLTVCVNWDFGLIESDYSNNCTPPLTFTVFPLPTATPTPTPQGPTPTPATPFIQTSGGDVHSNTRINTGGQ